MADNLPAVPDDGEIVRIPKPPAEARGLRPLRDAIGLASAQAKEMAEAGDRDGLTYGLVELTQLQKDLRMLLDEVGDHIINISPYTLNRRGNRFYPPFLVEETAYIEIRRKARSSTWESEELLDRLVGDAVVDKDSGEIPSPEQRELVARVLDVLKRAVPFTASLGWRKTALRELGIDPEDYSETPEDPGYTIKITGAQPE